MANIKSQKKRIKTNEKARLRNISYKSKLRTAMKQVKAAVEAGDKEKALVLVNKANSVIDRAVVKGIEHHKTAARQKSTLARLINGLK